MGGRAATKAAGVPVQQNRFELKYVIDEGRARAIRDFIAGKVVPDEYALPEHNYQYPNHSLYLDSPELTCFHEVLTGKKNRFKVRLRYYDTECRGPVFFEIKRRINDVIVKNRVPVQHDAVEGLLLGRWPTYDDLLHRDDDHDFATLQHICGLMATLRAEPRVAVSYMREAYVSPENETLRITFDRYIECMPHRRPSLPNLRLCCPLDGPSWTVLELKFTNTFPSWLHGMASCFNLHRRSFAKYVNSVKSAMRSGAYLYGFAHEARV